MYKIEREEQIDKAIVLIKGSYILRYGDISIDKRDELIERIFDTLKKHGEKFEEMEELVLELIQITKELENFLKDKLGSKFKKIAKSWRDLRSGNKTKKEFFADVLKVIGLPSFKILIKGIFMLFF